MKTPNVDEQLQGMLPAINSLGESNDIEVQTRAVLNLLVSHPLILFQVVDLNPSACPNCGVLFESTRSPYCSDECREIAAFVRQFRSAVREGSIAILDKQGALGQKLWYVLGGGYPRRDALVPDRVRLKVIERERGKCQQCGAMATTIDHSGSG